MNVLFACKRKQHVRYSARMHDWLTKEATAGLPASAGGKWGCWPFMATMAEGETGKQFQQCGNDGENNTAARSGVEIQSRAAGKTGFRPCPAYWRRQEKGWPGGEAGQLFSFLGEALPGAPLRSYLLLGRTENENENSR